MDRVPVRRLALAVALTWRWSPGRSGFEPTVLPLRSTATAVRLVREQDLRDTGRHQRVDDAEQHREDDDREHGVDQVAGASQKSSGVRPWTIGPSSSAGKKVSAATRMITTISSTTKVGVSVRNVPGPGGRDLLAGQRAGDGERGEHRHEAAEQHRQAAQQVGEGDAVGADVARRVRLHEAGVAGERGAVVVGLRRVGVERLREALRARVVDRRSARSCVAIATAVTTAPAAARRGSPINTSLTSRASIFLPRYSGVRPTISPAMNTARRTNSSIP